MSYLDAMPQGEREIVRAAEAACRDFMSGQGGCYSGPASGIYLRILGVLQTASAIREEETR